MSRQLLYDLNGDKKGALYNWLEGKKELEDIRICWYLSAGIDTKPLLFLHPNYDPVINSLPPIVPPPDIFIFTDGNDSRIINETRKNRELYDDEHTKITILEKEVLPRCENLPTDRKIMWLACPDDETGKIVYFFLDINSQELGNYQVPLIYILSENTVFFAKKALPNHARFSHIYRTNYGYGTGGGSSSGLFLLNVLNKVHCELFITGDDFSVHPGDERVFELFPELRGPYDNLELGSTRARGGLIFPNDTSYLERVPRKAGWNEEIHPHDINQYLVHQKE